ncbi:MAG: chromosome segregation protein SMC [Arenimonas sp.]|nr:chromosome segregation protein SMC [Arenimonas sp.]
MRLSTIKLSGFKSFVDPTVFHLPTNMTGIVGPNGCGKSNIIDAIRWVMGESSASRLRGDALTDVIFSGSSTRKPVSQATVELIFDNSEGKIGGEFARFSEISVKRSVSRDGQSNYYLNGSRCRRRDITDLFLGTGLGPRSYSIIEQGMIGQIIEAKPEELRVYLEEAAGISKYKERRKETESRIKSTRENLDRLNDLREEIDKQLEHLKKQARAAEQYQQLQAERAEKDAQLKAMDYRQLGIELHKHQEALRDGELQLQKLLAEQRHAEAQIEQCRSQQTEAAEALAKVQAEGYRVSGELARIEQQIQHQRELKQRLETARAEADQAFAQIESHLGEDQAKLDAVQAEIAALEPKLAALQSEQDGKLAALRQAEHDLQEWQQKWDACLKAQAEATRWAEVERTKIEYLEKQNLELSRRSEALQAERTSLDPDAIQAGLQAMEAEHATQRESLDRLAAELEERKAGQQALVEEQRQKQNELSEIRKQSESARGRLASLEALQHAALGQEDKQTKDWLGRQGLAGQSRLGEMLEVEAGWEFAVETALGALLEAVAVDDSDALLAHVAEVNQGHLALIDQTRSGRGFPDGTLAARIQGPDAIRIYLSRVHTASDLAAARNRLAGLAEHESVITPQGEWLSKGFVRVLRSGHAQQGSLRREAEIKATRADIERLAEDEKRVQADLAALKDRLLQAEQTREDAQRSLYLAHRGVSELSGQIQGVQGKLQSAQSRIALIDGELRNAAQTLDEAQVQVREARVRLQQAADGMGELERQRQALDEQRRTLGQARDEARQQQREHADASHQLALAAQSHRTAAAGLQQSIERLRQQRVQLVARSTELAEQLKHGDSPIEQLAAERQRVLDQRVLFERELSSARSALDGVEQELRRYEQQRQSADSQALAQREKITGVRLHEQAVALRAEQLKTAIEQAGGSIEHVLENLGEEFNPELWAKNLLDIDNKMRRLEPVNLAAIQEYGEQSERKTYLDAQNADLTQALETLEEAIRKIDRETRGRFKETFDRVNAGVQDLFPRLFGGGHAYLELTGEDLLDTGVAIMARPPGKRVSNITLLSGGEKALTAVSLVFAIFKLNPSPFCLLDEVDAPLDEANVGRFSSMVTEMSESVQFLFVTHNKATMESAKQLSGVTMREPGVSRMVSVDLAEATRLAGVA